MQLRALENLRELDLSGTKVDQTALEAVLRELPRLATLGLDRTGISWPARMKLRVKHRNLTIT